MKIYTDFKSQSVKGCVVLEYRGYSFSLSSVSDVMQPELAVFASEKSTDAILMLQEAHNELGDKPQEEKKHKKPGEEKK